ncbi:MAG TPA: UvrD-helicase domain-containing protein [Candidatus Synoicihabitans sp.]|nr:UvrD-helicase domain-containing protein [Candidatus Synoicihabitans sp.]
MIFASAGSGKTHALTTRYIRLLALGVEPERIVALTFTRKAAGEFFNEIVNRLARAAADGEAARALARDVGRSELGCGAFLGLLRRLVDTMHRLSLGTLDGFFARVVRTFPLELGLSGEPTILDERTAAEEVRRVLGRLLAAREALAPEQRALIEAFKLATFGTEDKAVAGRLDDFIAGHLALYRAAPAELAWGAAERIWPEGFPWGDARTDPAPAAAALRAWVAAADLRDKQRARWEKFAVAAAEWSPGGPMPRELTFVLEKALAAWPEIERGCAELRFDRQPQRLTREAYVALQVLVRRVVALELGRRLAVTQGIAAVLRAFDALYDVEVRRSGRLTFADLQQLLLPSVAGARLSAAPEESEGADQRLQLDYRLDARFDHWMFDEFQDTSFHQWQILQNLVDEVMADPSGQRSFFFVGDVKQAIYTWREGDPRLFAYVASRYTDRAGGGIVARELNDSWRSGPAVIEMVNHVCGDAAVMRELFPEAAAEWIRHWRMHRTARPNRHGQAALLFASGETGRWAATLRVLGELEPTARGLSCAVLVRTNEIGARLADYLRREGGFAAVAEADLHISADNPVAAGLAALLQAAAHPGDTLAQGHVAMTPIGDVLTAEGVVSGDAVSRHVLREVQSGGFQAWFEAWARRLEPVLEARDAFSRLRLRQLIAAGQTFDESGSRDPDAFLRFLAQYTVREPEGAGVIRVMTIHKSKGLGFDVVLLPDLEGDRLAQRRKGPAVSKTTERAIDWVMEYPGELLATHDPVLREYLREAVAENCYEQLSLLYVALTRAKHALYAIVEPPGRSTSRNFPRLLTHTLGEDEVEIAVGDTLMRGAWTGGDPHWHRRLTIAPREAEPAEVASLSDEVGETRTLEAHRPSAGKNARLDAGQLFTGRALVSAEYGHAVHALLAEVEWLPRGRSSAVEEWAGRWGARSGIDPAAIEEAVACLGAGDLETVWYSPGGDAEVWRERSFEVVLEGTWLTGVFDRVVIARGPDGRAVRATIYDFKTDRVDVEAAAAVRHRAQLESYRQAVARLVGLPLAAVAAEVIFTARRSRVTVS